MLPENEQNAPNRPENDSDSPMSILERRLAEIARTRQDTDAPADAAAQTQVSDAATAGTADEPEVLQPAEVGMAVPSAVDVPPPSFSGPDSGALISQSEQPSVASVGGSAEVPAQLAADPQDAGMASGSDSSQPTTAPGMPAGTIYTESTPVLPAPSNSAPATDSLASSENSANTTPTTNPVIGGVSASQTRAEEHYGNTGPGAVAVASHQNASTEAPAGTTSASESAAESSAFGSLEAEAQALVGDQHSEPLAVSLPAEPLTSAEQLENNPAPLAALPTSNNESASEAAAAAAAHEEEEEYVPETSGPDFSTLDVAGQGQYILDLLQRPDARQNRKQIHDLHRLYEQGINTDRAASRQRFTEAGNEAEAFTYTGPEGYSEVSKGMQDYREARVRDAKQEDEQRIRNLEHKQQLLTQLRQLVESAETKDSSARIKALQADWKATGPVPQQQSQELWNSYHALLDIYYNNRGLFFEMKELDRRRNLEAKEALIQRAEALAQQSSINKALTELRQLHEEWKTIGPVANDQREPLWQRFLQASEKVHERKRSFMETRSTQENANLTRKQELLAQILPFGEFKTERVNEWRSKTDELQALKEQWDAAGLVPRSQAETMNKQFWAAYKGFFQHKNQYFKALDEEKARNLKAKVALCEQAEAALENPNWEEGREVVIRVQKEWKDIGRVPEKQSDKIWHRFRTACDAFFERKNQEVKQREQHVQQLSQEQTARLDRIASHVGSLTADNPGTSEGLQALMEEWSQGDNPNRRGSAQAEEKFLELLGKYMSTIPGLSYQEREDQLFQLQVQRMKSNPDAQQLLYRKEQNLRREINELENDVATLQTNLDFFARSKNAGQLREEYQGRIDETKKRIERLKRQLRTVRS